MVRPLHRLEQSSNRLCVEVLTTSTTASCLLSYNQHRPGRGHISIDSSRCSYRASIHFLCTCPMVAIHTRYALCWVFFLTHHRNHGKSFRLWNLDKIQSGMLHKHLWFCQTCQHRTYHNSHCRLWTTNPWDNQCNCCFFLFHQSKSYSNMIHTERHPQHR